jgi:hypothetical protein
MKKSLITLNDNDNVNCRMKGFQPFPLAEPEEVKSRQRIDYSSVVDLAVGFMYSKKRKLYTEKG